MPDLNGHTNEVIHIAVVVVNTIQAVEDLRVVLHASLIVVQSNLALVEDAGVIGVGGGAFQDGVLIGHAESAHDEQLGLGGGGVTFLGGVGAETGSLGKEGIVSHLSHGAAVGLTEGGVALDIIKHLQGLSLVDEAIGIGVHGAGIAHGDQEHLAGLGILHDVGGPEVAVVTAIADAQIHSPGDVAGRPTVGSDIREGSGALVHGGIVVLAVDQNIQNLGELLTGIGARGVVGAILKALQNFEGGKQVDSGGIIIIVLDVGESACACADGKRQNHRQCQNQRENSFQISHLVSSS